MRRRFGGGDNDTVTEPVTEPAAAPAVASSSPSSIMSSIRSSMPSVSSMPSSVSSLMPSSASLSAAASSAASAASAAASSASSALSSASNSPKLKILYDSMHYAYHGYSKEDLLKYTIVDPNASDSQRIANIEKGVNELNLVIKSSASISKVARNAFISYIVTYILFAIIIILNVGILVKKACQNVSTSDSFSNNEVRMRNPPARVKMREIMPELQKRLYE